MVKVLDISWCLSHQQVDIVHNAQLSAIACNVVKVMPIDVQYAEMDTSLRTMEPALNVIAIAVHVSAIIPVQLVIQDGLSLRQ